ncbi:MAG: phosphoglucosamine mutase, partial [Desulfobacterales bacterium]
MGKLFGTDGIRGIANEYPMTAEMALMVGRAVVAILKGRKKKSKIIIGKDTRASGFMLEHALVSGVCSMGADAYLAGTIPTPGVAVLTTVTAASAGIVVSASHNPFYDNGIKLYNSDGFKVPDDKEGEIEQAVLNGDTSRISESIRDTGRVYRLEDASRIYTAFLKRCCPREFSLNGMKIALDCSNGATYQVAPQLFSELGAQIESIAVGPDGKNINADCGSEHPQALAAKVLETKADIGLAFDGDGDRLLAVDEKGGL